MPGLDPHKEIEKKCQDLCLFSSDEDSIFLALFDGHGSIGEKVVDFCGKVVQNQYNVSKAEYQTNPINFLTNVTLKCDSDLKSPNSGVDVTSSGSTEVLVLIQNGAIYSASVGDSRAILASKAPPLRSPAPNAFLGIDRKILEDVSKRRNSVINPLIHAVQLTKDQKPEDPDELARIIKSGGRVQRLTDDKGNKIGPYRVWEMNANVPGLAMSRSIGDSTGGRIGIISNPVTTSHNMSVGNDCFVVAASDGIWDVFENSDVINFVEYYRNKCIRDMTSRPTEAMVNTMNTNIAHLLCEEARIRWFTIVEEEDVIIDDISCVIIELISESVDLGRQSGAVPDANAEPVEQIEHMPIRRAPTTHDIKTRDPRRGSVVAERIDLER